MTTPSACALRTAARRISPRIAERAHHRECRHEIGAATLHLGERLVVDPGAVLDAAHTGPHGIGRTLACMGMGRNEQAFLRGLGHGCAYFVLGKLGLAWIGTGESRPLAGADLDDIGAPGDQCARRFGNAFRAAQLAVDGVTELRVDHVERHPRLRADVAGRHQQLRSRHMTQPDQVARADRLQVRVAEHA
jgi:hypothetical protein